MDKTISGLELAKDLPKVFEIIIIPQYGNTLESVIVKKERKDKVELGTSLQILKSIHKHFDSIELLVKSCFIESTGSVATSLWEKSIALQYLLNDPSKRVKKYISHDSFRYTPWSVKKMVKNIVHSENRIDHNEVEKNIILLYMQYSYLCAIKHGNPYTLSYLNRLVEDANLFKPDPSITNEDISILKWIYLNSMTTFLDALQSFSSYFCKPDQSDLLSNIDQRITFQLIPKIEMVVPPIIRFNDDDFEDDFFEYLKELVKKR